MELLNKQYKQKIRSLLITLLIILGILAFVFFRVSQVEKDYLDTILPMLIFLGSIFTFSILFSILLVAVQVSKTKKNLHMISPQESEELQRKIVAKDRICTCIFLENHLVMTKALTWSIIPYDKIRSIKCECTVYKSYGIPAGKSYNIFIAMKEGKPANYTIPVKKKILDAQYPEFAGRLGEKCSDIYEAGINARYR